MNLKKLLLAWIVAVMAVSCDKYADLPDGIYASVKTDKGTAAPPGLREHSDDGRQFRCFSRRNHERRT